jgi:uncharacterized protein YndB with AHSA1/START domain
MNDTALKSGTRNIELDEVFPHTPETLWKALTTEALIGRWLGMTPTGFAPAVGNRFTYRTTPAGRWDGTIHCEVLEVIPNQRFIYAWRGGHEGNVGYGAPLDTVVTFTLSKVDGGTRLRVVHSGFIAPQNDTAYKNMSEGWKQCARNIGAIAAERD